MPPTGATRLFPIIGDPIRYVESPARLTRTLEKRGHDGLCVPVEVPAGDLPTVMAGLTAARNVDGILVTMPHKFAAYAYCATTSARARLLGVVSILRREPDGTWHGDMLDGLAFVKAQQDHGARPEGARVAPARRRRCGQRDRRSPPRGRRPGTGRPRPRRVACRHPAGPAPRPGPGDRRPARPHRLRPGQQRDPVGHGRRRPASAGPGPVTSFVGDVIAGHGRTPLLAAAEAAGCRTANGTNMVEAAQDVMAGFLLRQAT